MLFKRVQIIAKSKEDFFHLKYIKKVSFKYSKSLNFTSFIKVNKFHIIFIYYYNTHFRGKVFNLFSLFFVRMHSMYLFQVIKKIYFQIILCIRKVFLISRTAKILENKSVMYRTETFFYLKMHYLYKMLHFS